MIHYEKKSVLNYSNRSSPTIEEVLYFFPSEIEIVRDSFIVFNLLIHYNNDFWLLSIWLKDNFTLLLRLLRARAMYF